MAGQDNKTEKPTGRRRKKAREKGQVARSRDLTMAMSSLAAIAALAAVGPWAIQRLAGAVATGLIGVQRMAGRDLKPEDLTSLVTINGALIGLLVGPIALSVAVVTVASSAMQGGLNFATAALRPSLGRLNPISGLKRLAPSQSGLDTVKMILTLIILGAIAIQICRTLAADALRFPWMSPVGAAGAGWASVERLLWQAGFALLAVGGADYALQRWRLTTSLRMTKQEVRDEVRLAEGSPEIKARVRRVQFEMFRRRMLQATATATVVITNPTHYAVALEYRREKNPAPVVVAKGRDLLAQRIREIAREHGVPIVENPPLARALHQGAEVGDTIPAALFGAVAEVLAYLIRIKQLMF